MASDNTEKNGAESDRPPTKETNGKDLHIDLEDLDENGDQDSNLNETYVIDTAKKTFPQKPVHVKRPETDIKSIVDSNVDHNEPTTNEPIINETHRTNDDVNDDVNDRSVFPQKPVVVNRLTNNVKCDQCGMLFTNSESLRQHKQKFCLGVEETGLKKYLNSSPTPQENMDTNSLHNENVPKNGSLNTTLNNSIFNKSRNDDLDFNNSTNDFKLNPYQAQSAINELKSYKNKKTMEQSLRDMEDTLIRDTIRDKKLTTSSGKTPLNIMTTPDQYNIRKSGTSLNSFNKYIKSPQNKDDPFKYLVKEVSH